MRRGSATACAALLSVLTACSTSGSGTVDTPVVSSPPASVPSSAPAVSSPSVPSSVPVASSPSLPTSSAAPVSASSTPPPPSSSATPSGPPSCTAQQLTISLVRGGAVQQRQLAGLVFTNTSTTRCTVLGFPSAQLVKGGQLLGRPATPTGSPGAGVTLAPKASAQAQLTATTDCSAPLSDHVRVRAPGLSVSADVADTLRACTLTVGAVEPA